ncbi:stage II sporulation protein M [Paenibacillus sp. LHD-117]|uniref:stage II sporulation protein M n=1 Tax=Paenibacillus sp. LHD-117 TaxID=3071412 RepID=UPI0027E0D0B9|nr:stage II sporulation protein M [Paenibacillus sp. LHD-117]MDQ6421023.1 stage II sporulation protein M [Paenibacillus sp. LHD-117]
MKYSPNLYIFVSVLFVVGAIFGALIVGALTLEQQQELAGEISRYVQSVDSGAGLSAEELFWDRFWFHFKWMMLIWILGITVIGIPGILALNFLKGALIGFAIGVLIQQYGWKGIVFFFISVVPQNIIAVPALIISSAAAISFAVYVVKHRLMLQQQKEGLLPQLGMLTSTTMIMMFLFAGAALFEAYLSPALIGWASVYLPPSNGTI